MLHIRLSCLANAKNIAAYEQREAKEKASSAKRLEQALAGNKLKTGRGMRPSQADTTDSVSLKPVPGNQAKPGSGKPVWQCRL